MHKLKDIFENKRHLNSIFCKDEELIIDGTLYSIDDCNIFNNFKIKRVLLNIRSLISDFLISKNQLGINYKQLSNSKLLLEMKRELTINIKDTFIKSFIFENRINVIKAFMNKVLEYGISHFFDISFFEEIIDKHNLRMLRVVNGEITCYSYDNKWLLDTHLSNEDIREHLFRLCRKSISLNTSRHISSFSGCIIDILKQESEVEEMIIVNIIKNRSLTFDQMKSYGVIDSKNISILETHIAVGGSIVIERDYYGLFISLFSMFKDKDFVIIEKEKEITKYRSIVYEDVSLDLLEKIELDSFGSNKMPFSIFITIAYRLKIPFIASFSKLSDSELEVLASYPSKILYIRYSRSKKRIELESLQK